MSRQAHLPPRCPFQKKPITSPNGLISPTSWKDSEIHPHHQKSVSQSSILEDQPAWLDDLLNDSDSNAKGIIHRRSASDSSTVFDAFDSLPSLKTLKDDENSGHSKTSSGLEPACIYGPNSPRDKGKLIFPEKAIVSALSEYVSQKSMQSLDGGLCTYEMAQFDSVPDSCGSAGDATTLAKRHSGQRSRVRKLQYIAELEKTVDLFQTLGSELAIKVASLLQQRVALSMENTKLKQQVSRMKQEKLIVDGQYLSLRKEAERLRRCLDRKVHASMRSNLAGGEAFSSESMWQMPDLGKLDL